MRIELNPALLLTPKTSGIKFNNGINRASFGNLEGKDSFQTSSVDKYFTENFVRSALDSNYALTRLLKKYKLPENLNLKELGELKETHLSDTQDICMRIADNLPYALKLNVNLTDLKKAAMLHDIGKVLIPPEILNKNGRLTSEEFKVMRLHSELGYQLLRNTDLNGNVLYLIRNHHNNLLGKNRFVYDIDLQILNLADKYSALTEKRVYKPALSPQQALTILAGEVQEGKVHPTVFNALVKSINSNPFASLDTVSFSANIA